MCTRVCVVSECVCVPRPNKPRACFDHFEQPVENAPRLGSEERLLGLVVLDVCVELHDRANAGKEAFRERHTAAAFLAKELRKCHRHEPVRRGLCFGLLLALLDEPLRSRVYECVVCMRNAVSKRKKSESDHLHKRFSDLAHVLCANLENRVAQA